MNEREKCKQDQKVAKPIKARGHFLWKNKKETTFLYKLVLKVHFKRVSDDSVQYLQLNLEE